MVLHDEALRGLFAAFEAGFDDVGVPVWVTALRAWHQVVSDHDYWAHVVELEQRGAFEPAAFPSEIDALRDEAVGLAAEPLVVAGRDALARDDTSTVRRILTALEELAATGPWAATAAARPPIVGTWRATVQLKDCQTGNLIGLPFPSLLTFDLGGTMTETTANPMFFPADRGPGHGVWSQNGHQTYAASSTAFITLNGALVQRQVITQTIELGDDPNQFVSPNATVQFFAPDDTLLRTGCAMAVGQRFP